MKRYRNRVAITLLAALGFLGFIRAPASAQSVEQKQTEIAENAALDISKSLYSAALNGLTNEDLLKDIATALDKKALGRITKSLGWFMTVLDVSQDIAEQDPAKLAIDTIGATAAILLADQAGHLLLETAGSAAVGVCITMAKVTLDSFRALKKESAGVEISALYEMIYADPIIIPPPPNTGMKTSRLTLIKNKDKRVFTRVLEKLYDESKFAGRLSLYISSELQQPYKLPARTRTVNTGEKHETARGDFDKTTVASYTKEEYIAMLRADKQLGSHIQSLLLEVNKEIQVRKDYFKLRQAAIDLQAKVDVKKLGTMISLLKHIDIHADDYRALNEALLTKHAELLEILKSPEPEEINGIRKTFAAMKESYASENYSTVTACLAAQCLNRAALAKSISAGIEEIADPEVITLKTINASIGSIRSRDMPEGWLRNKVADAVKDIEKLGKGLRLRFKLLKADEVADMLDTFNKYLADTKAEKEEGGAGHFKLGVDDKDQSFSAVVTWDKTVTVTYTSGDIVREKDFSKQGKASLGFVDEDGDMRATAIQGDMFWVPINPPLDFLGTLTITTIDEENAPVSAIVTLFIGRQAVGNGKGPTADFENLKTATYSLSVMAAGHHPILGKKISFDPMQTPERKVTVTLTKNEPAPAGEKKRLILNLPNCKYWRLIKDDRCYITGYYLGPAGQKINYTSLPLANFDENFPTAGLVATAGGVGYHVYVAIKHSRLGYNFNHKKVNDNFNKHMKEISKLPPTNDLEEIMARGERSKKLVEEMMAASVNLIVNRMKGEECRIIHEIKITDYYGIYPDAGFKSYTIKYKTKSDGPVKKLILK